MNYCTNLKAENITKNWTEWLKSSLENKGLKSGMNELEFKSLHFTLYKYVYINSTLRTKVIFFNFHSQIILSSRWDFLMNRKSTLGMN